MFGDKKFWEDTILSLEKRLEVLEKRVGQEDETYCDWWGSNPSLNERLDKMERFLGIQFTIEQKRDYKKYRKQK